MEIERKFLVKNNDWLKDIRTFHHLKQGYLSFPVDKNDVNRNEASHIQPEVRVRLASKPFRATGEHINFAGLGKEPLGEEIFGEETLSGGDLDHSNFSDAFLTVKSKGTLVRSEVESAIDLDAAKEMLNACIGTIISKTRYLIPAHVPNEDIVFEVDVYHGALEGLITAEVELKDINQIISLPQWIGEDITEITSYKNAVLAKNGMPHHRPSSSSSSSIS